MRFRRLLFSIFKTGLPTVYFNKAAGLRCPLNPMEQSGTAAPTLEPPESISGDCVPRKPPAQSWIVFACAGIIYNTHARFENPLTGEGKRCLRQRRINRCLKSVSLLRHSRQVRIHNIVYQTPCVPPVLWGRLWLSRKPQQVRIHNIFRVDCRLQTPEKTPVFRREISGADIPDILVEHTEHRSHPDA